MVLAPLQWNQPVSPAAPLESSLAQKRLLPGFLSARESFKSWRCVVAIPLQLNASLRIDNLHAPNIAITPWHAATGVQGNVSHVTNSAIHHV